ncbi:MAG: hypothetical protein CM1200mP18_19600 [Gammaproteobacteria bacterium]|nr:MAG: hypothetical protein CM1200mP18_19600 [Gammaproteobacteria bacterium]
MTSDWQLVSLPQVEHSHRLFHRVPFWVIYAIIVEESVGQLLLAGFIPGIISAVIYAVLISGRVMLNPELAPTTERYPWSERFRSLPGTTPIVAVIAIIFTAIYGGWATPTEAGALGRLW